MFIGVQELQGIVDMSQLDPKLKRPRLGVACTHPQHVELVKSTFAIVYCGLQRQRVITTMRQHWQMSPSPLWVQCAAPSVQTMMFGSLSESKHMPPR